MILTELVCLKYRMNYHSITNRNVQHGSEILP